MSRPASLWRRAGPSDLDTIRRFLSERETFAAGLSGRILRPAGGLSLPSRPGGLFLFGPDRIMALAAFMSTGTVFPVAPADASIDCFPALSRSPALRSFRPASCVGLAGAVDRIEAAMKWEPTYRIAYRVMSLDLGDFAPTPVAGADGLVASAIARRAGPRDLDALCPLAEAYEIEEVMTPLHRFEASACRSLQAKALDSQVVYLAETGGRVVARAQTNARGWIRDQIGGVFVVPEFRGRGLGRLVVQALVGDRLAAGRGLSLFVKESNAPATGLYLSMGFKVQGTYRVDYFG